MSQDELAKIVHYEIVPILKEKGIMKKLEDMNLSIVVMPKKAAPHFLKMSGELMTWDEK